MFPTGDLLVTWFFIGELACWACSEHLMYCAGMAHCQGQYTHQGNSVCLWHCLALCCSSCCLGRKTCEHACVCPSATTGPSATLWLTCQLGVLVTRMENFVCTDPPGTGCTHGATRAPNCGSAIALNTTCATYVSAMQAAITAAAPRSIPYACCRDAAKLANKKGGPNPKAWWSFVLHPIRSAFLVTTFLPARDHWSYVATCLCAKTYFEESNACLWTALFVSVNLPG